MQNPNKVIEKAIKERDVYGLVKFLFGHEITPGEEEIIRAIVFDPDNRIAITAHTRYGKTWAVAIAILLWVLFNPDHEVDVVSPVMSQSQKLMQYIGENISKSAIMRKLVDTQTRSIERLKAEVSKTHITFKNGSNIRILSGAGTGERLMGHGGQLLVVDESCLMNYEVYRTKISRMEEGKEGSRTKIVQISNPWHKGNHFYQAWINPKYKNIQVGWEQGLSEGLISQEKVDEQRELLSSLEFTVLYDSAFPDSADDALIKNEQIIAAQQKPDLNNGTPVWSLDPAEKGTDKAILSRGIQQLNIYDLLYQEELIVNDTMRLVAEIIKRVPKEHILYIDTIGVGAGVESRLKELGYNTVSVRVSRSPTIDNDRYLNQKSQFYWRLRELFEHDQIILPEEMYNLHVQLQNMRWDITTGGKIRIIDPDGPSPDYADSLMLMCCDYSEPKVTISIGKLSSKENNKKQKIGTKGIDIFQ